ncbi:MAG: hypothetical protein EXS10_09315 [Phycisphaerales bacterium]|nr:hypothetical protein [Phycisphaerales bacterium]
MTSTTRFFVAIAFGAALPLCGACQNRKVVVEITATDGCATRTFATNEKDADALAKVSEVYGNTGEADAALGRRFTGTFAEDAMPSEIGNRGAIGVAKSSFGTTSMYFEQFADRRNEWEAFKHRVESGLLWARILGRFIETRQIKDEVTRASFHAWWNDEVVPLTSDLYLMYSGMQAVIQSQRIGAKPRKAPDYSPRTDDEFFRMEVLEPLAILLAERGWVSADELILLQASSIDGFVSPAELTWISEHVLLPAAARLARKFDPKIDAKTLKTMAPMAIDFLLWLKFSREYKDLVLASEAVSVSTKDAIRAGVWDFVLPAPFGFRIGERPAITEALVKLNTGALPYQTNGQYDAATTQVIFDGDFYEADARYAPYNAPYYAMWSLPAQRQETVFGSVILEGEALAAYCMWELSLDASTRISWDSALEQLALHGDAKPARELLLSTLQLHPMPRALAVWITSKAKQPLPTEYDGRTKQPVQSAPLGTPVATGA